MENEGGFINRYPKQAKTNAALRIHSRNNTAVTAPPTANVNAVNTAANSDIDLHGQPANPPPPEECLLREQDRYMPIANVIRIMRRILPPHAKISDDAKETVQECVTEFIGFVTGEANYRCHNEQRKTVTAEDVISSLGKLGFDNYVPPLKIYMHRYREKENQRSSAQREPNVRSGGSDDGVEVGVVDYGPLGVDGVGPIGPATAAYNLGPQQAYYDPLMNVFRINYPDSGGSSSSQANQSGFDPFA
ncbi:hypothetical protein ACOSQ4_030508 [Xanthoceras sorbifolium]